MKKTNLHDLIQYHNLIKQMKYAKFFPGE